MPTTDQKQIEQAEQELEQWLVEQAQAGVAELVLAGMLRDHADSIDELGYVPRAWADSNERPR